MLHPKKAKAQNKNPSASQIKKLHNVAKTKIKKHTRMQQNLLPKTPKVPLKANRSKWRKAFKSKEALSELNEGSSCPSSFFNCDRDNCKAYGYVSITNITAIAASLDSPWPNNLCTTPNYSAASSAWIGIVRSIGASYDIVQIGHVAIRNTGSSVINYTRFVEAFTAGGISYFPYSGSAPSRVSADLECYLWQSSGGAWYWVFSCSEGGDSFSYLEQDIAYPTYKYNNAYWSCEVWDLGDDMFGTASDPCDFYDCQFGQNFGSYQGANFVSHNPGSIAAGTSWLCENCKACITANSQTEVLIWDCYL